MTAQAAPQESPTRPLIEAQPPLESEARVDAILNTIREHIGFVPDGLRLYGISPPLLEAFVANINYFLGGTRLPQHLTTMIRYLVSSKNNCQFCIDLNEGFLAQMTIDLDQARAAREDPDRAPVEARDKPLLRLALKSALDPHGVEARDLDAARQQGWEDRDIFDAVVQGAHTRGFNQVLATFKLDQQGVLA